MKVFVFTFFYFIVTRFWHLLCEHKTVLYMIHKGKMVLKKIVTLVLIVVKNEHTEWG